MNAASLRPSVLFLPLLVSAFVGHTALAQSPVNPPPWWRVNDENTVSLAWNFDNAGSPTVPTTVVVPSWYSPSVTRFTTPLPPNLTWVQNLNGHLGVLGMVGNGTPLLANLDLKVDNFPHVDWVKIFWVQFDSFRGAGGDLSQSIRQDLAKYKRATVTESHDSLTNGWERVTISAQLIPQPDDETIDWQFTENALGTVAIDNLFVNSKCIKPGADETGDAIGDPDGLRIDLTTQTGGADCMGAAVTEGPGPSFLRNYWVSTRAGTGLMHQIFRLNQAGGLVTTVGLGVSSTQAPFGASDLAVERFAPTVGPVQQIVYTIVDRRPSGGNVVILAIDESTNLLLPLRSVTLTNFPPVAPQAFGLAFDASGDTGAGTFWVTDQNGNAFEFNRAGSLLETHGIPTGVTGFGYDEALGYFYGFSQAVRPSPAGPVQVNGFEWSGYDYRPTGIEFVGDLTIPNLGGPNGGLASGLDVYRRHPNGEFRLVCVVQAVTAPGQTKALLYELAGPFRFGYSQFGRCGMRGGPPFVGSTNFEVTLSGVPNASFALLYVGFNNQSYNGLPLPLPLASAGLLETFLSISPDLSTGVMLPSAPGEFSFPLVLPASAGLSYVPLFFQWVVLDATVPGFLAGTQAGKTVAY